MLNGIDIASHQAGINAGAMPGDFVIIKATGGTQYVNPYCDTFYQSAKMAGKLLGIYHYAYEAYCPGTPEQEAEHFLKNVQGYIGEAVLILDFEAENKADVNWAKRWLDYVYQKTGIKPMFYTYTAVLNAADFSPIAKADYGLWLANYGTNHVQGYNQPSTPAGKGFPSVAMHQYTSSGRLDGWSGNLDLNIFYGDAKAWKAYASNKSTAPSVTAPVKKSDTEIANEVIADQWSTGQDRINKLTAAGYNAAVIQNLVNVELDKTGKWIAKNGTFKLNTAIYLRTDANASSAEIALISASQTIKYDAYKIDKNGYYWIRQPRGNSYGYMAVGETKAGSLVSSWGVLS